MPPVHAPSTAPRSFVAPAAFRSATHPLGDGRRGVYAILPCMRRLLSTTRPGQTLVELSLVLAIIGLASMIAVSELKRHLDRLAVRNAVAEAATLVARARDEA